MLTLSRTIFVAAILLNAVAASFAQASPQDAKQTSSITGRVTSSDGDNQPLPGVGIVLMPFEGGRGLRKPTARATTDADGFYRLANVPAGSYRLNLLAPGFTPAGTLTPHGSGESRAVHVEAGETIEHQDFALARGGVITGRVMDADGKPAIAEYMRLVYANHDPRSGSANVSSVYGFETDDRGVYRMYGLPPGRYLVCVGEEKEHVAVNTALTGRNRTRTCHPNATEEARAKIVEVSHGGEATGVDITLAPSAKTYEARGRMLDAETGQPVANLSYGFGVLAPDGKHIPHRGWSNAKTTADGEFRFGNLLPGRYAVFVVTRDGDAPNYYSEALPFEIDDGNLRGLVLKVRRGATLRGVASVEGTTDRAVLAKLAQVALHVHVMLADPKSDELQARSNARLTLQPDGSFHVGGLPPGKAVLMLDEFSSPRGFTLLRVERGATEQREGIELGAGEQVSDVRLRLAYGTTVLRGQIETRSDGQPSPLPEGVRIHVSMRRVVGGVRSSGDGISIEVDRRGRFIREGLVAGEYELTASAWMPPTPSAPRGAGFAPVWQTVTLPEKGEINVTVVYDLSAKPHVVKP